jgi:hypothetical protein
MAAPFVMITTHRIHPDKLEQLAALTAEYTGFVEATEPRLQAHVAYIDAEHAEVSFVQVHPDAESAENHMQVAGPHIARGLELVDTVSVDVYGEPGPAVRHALEANADLGARVSVKPASLGGFVRA